MISSYSRNGVILLSALLMVSFWASRKQEAQDSGPTAGLDPRLDYALSNFELRLFDGKGQPAVFLTSPRFTSDTASGEGLAIDPVLDVIHEGFFWNIVAESATITDDREFIQLSGAVRLTRDAGQPGSQLRVDSSEVTLEVTPRIARSEQHVEVSDISSTLTATGFSVNMKNSKYQLMNDVEGRYVIQ